MSPNKNWTKCWSALTSWKKIKFRVNRRVQPVQWTSVWSTVYAFSPGIKIRPLTWNVKWQLNAFHVSCDRQVHVGSALQLCWRQMSPRGCISCIERNWHRPFRPLAGVKNVNSTAYICVWTVWRRFHFVCWTFQCMSDVVCVTTCFLDVSHFVPSTARMDGVMSWKASFTRETRSFDEFMWSDRWMIRWRAMTRLDGPPLPLSGGFSELKPIFFGFSVKLSGAWCIHSSNCMLVLFCSAAGTKASVTDCLDFSDGVDDIHIVHHFGGHIHLYVYTFTDFLEWKKTTTTNSIDSLKLLLIAKAALCFWLI